MTPRQNQHRLAGTHSASHGEAPQSVKAKQSAQIHANEHVTEAPGKTPKAAMIPMVQDAETCVSDCPKRQRKLLSTRSVLRSAADGANVERAWPLSSPCPRSSR